MECDDDLGLRDIPLDRDQDCCGVTSGGKELREHDAAVDAGCHVFKLEVPESNKGLKLTYLVDMVPPQERKYQKDFNKSRKRSV